MALPVEIVELAIAEGWRAFREGQLDAAAGYFQFVLARRPGHADARAALAAVRSRLEQVELLGQAERVLVVEGRASKG